MSNLWLGWICKMFSSWDDTLPNTIRSKDCKQKHFSKIKSKAKGNLILQSLLILMKMFSASIRNSNPQIDEAPKYRAL